MPPKKSVPEKPKKKFISKNNTNIKPVALILAGYNLIDSETKKNKLKELQEAYDGDVIYMGQNKFLHNLAGKPIIKYIIDAVYNAENKNTSNSKTSERLYDKIYVYNDIKSINKMIDLSNYSNLIVKQMKDSVGGHIKDFCDKYIKYRQRVDIFFGDTPRITSKDVEWIHQQYDNILGRKKDHRGTKISLIFSFVEFKDMKDNWLEHRLRYIKRGRNKGKLKYFLGFENFQARIGNSAAFIMDKSLNGLIEHEAINIFYNLRKVLTPSTISKIIYYFWKTKHFNMIKQIKNKCINEEESIDTLIDVISKLYKIDLGNLGVHFYHIKKNASRWENDIDSPLDMEKISNKFKSL